MTHKTKGFTFAEVLVSLVVLEIVGYIVAMVMVTQTKMSGQLDKQNLLVEVMRANQLEIDTRKLSDLPMNSECRVRHYSLTGEFIDETIASSTSADCLDFIPTTPGMKIVWLVGDVDSTLVKFYNQDGTINNFLKLPSLVTTIKAVKIQAGLMDLASGKTSQLSMMIYKR